MKPFSILIQQAKPSLTIKKNEGQHRLEIAKSVTLSSPATNQRLDAVENKNTEQDTKIATLETSTEALKAREDVAVRFYQGDAPADTEPLAVGATLLDIEINKELNETNLSDLRNLEFRYNNTNYFMPNIFYGKNQRGGFFLFLAFERKDKKEIARSDLNDLCVGIDNDIFMLSAADFFSDWASGCSHIE